MRDNKDEIQPNAVYTLADVCRIFHISDATVRRMIKDGTLPAPRVGRAYRFLGSTLLQYLNTGGATHERNGFTSRLISQAKKRR